MTKFAIGIDLGGTYTKLALVDSKGRISHRAELSTAAYGTRDGLIGAIVSEVGAIVCKAGLTPAKVRGVGIGVPGLVEFRKGLVYNLTNVPGWKNTPLKQMLERKLKIPVLVDNDVNVMALGECRFGSGKGSKNLVCITLGTGVGGGIIIDGNIYRGSTYSAGEIGHMPLKEEGLACGCGSYGCLERYVGNRYISAEYAKKAGKDPSRVTPEDISKAAKKGDKLALDFWKTVGKRIGVNLAGIVNLLNPESIIIGGGVAEAGGPLFKSIRQTVKERALPIPAKAVAIKKAKLGNDAGIVGAAALFLTFALAVTVSLSAAPAALAVETAVENPELPDINYDKNSKEPVVINGDSVEYSESGKTAIANGNVVIKYQDLKLTCKKAIFHTDTNEVSAEGDVLLTQGANTFRGEQITYNVEAKTGTVLKPSVFIQPTYYGGGEKAEKQSENHYYIQQGYVTTCDKEKPHYRVQTKQLNVYINDRVTAKNILLYVGDVPIFYFPYVSIPLKDMHPGVTVVPGQNKDWGYFVLTSWRYYVNEHIKGRFHLDYRELRDFAYGIDTYYKTDDYGDGVFRFNYFDERQHHFWTTRPEQPDDTIKGQDIDRTRAQLRHKWQMDTRTLGTVEINKMSDANIIKDYYLQDYYRDMVSSNYASVIRTDDYYTTSFLVQPRVNRFDSVVEYLPQAQFETRSLKIGQTDFYYDGKASAANINKVEPAPINHVASANRVDTNNQLSYQKNILGWLSVRPFTGTQQTYYSRDAAGDEKNFMRGNFFTGIDLNTRFYKTYNVKSDAYGMEINGLRHVISPTVSYYYAHRPTVSPTLLSQFDDIDALTFSNVISPSLENKVQTKRMVGDSMQTVDLARFVVSNNYDFRSGQKKKGRLGNFSLSFESKPYNWMRILSTSTYNPRESAFKTFTFNIVGDPEYNLDNPDLRGEVYTDITRKKWSWGAGYRWEDNLFSQMEGQLMFNLSEKWKITAYERFDFKRFGTDVTGAPRKFINQLAEQEYRISRDLHCWIGEFVYDVSQDHGYTFMVVFRLKAFPEIPFEFQQNYNPPRFGSTLPPG